MLARTSVAARMFRVILIGNLAIKKPPIDAAGIDPMRPRSAPIRDRASVCLGNEVWIEDVTFPIDYR